MKPILFNAEMVRAIQDGLKTVTRRVIKDKDIINAWDCEDDGTPIAFMCQETGDHYPPTHPCPYQPGDILHVRETWRKDIGRYMYKADYSDGEKFYRNGKEVSIKWRPSIHMPREAARIFLRVTDVQVERLQDITPEQIDAEGCKEYGYSVKTGELMPSSPSYFRIVWDSTIKPKCLAIYGWAANPWVWVIKFERISKEEALHNADST